MKMRFLPLFLLVAGIPLPAMLTAVQPVKKGPARPGTATGAGVAKAKPGFLAAKPVSERPARPTPPAPPARNNFFTSVPQAAAPASSVGAGVARALPGAQPKSAPLPAGALIRPVFDAGVESPSRRDAPLLRPMSRNSARPLPPSLDLSALSLDGPKEPAVTRGHRRNTAWGEGLLAGGLLGAGAGAGAGATATTSEGVTVAFPQGVTRRVDGAGVLKQAFELTNTSGQTLILFQALRASEAGADVTAYVFSSTRKGDPAELNQAVVEYWVDPKETIAVFIDNPLDVMNFRVVDEGGALLRALAVTRPSD